MSVRWQPRQVARIIDTEDDIAAGVRSLRRRCHIMRAVHKAAGDPPLRRRPGGFEGLAQIIVAQQLSVASASAIWERTRAAIAPMTAAQLVRLDDEALRGAGLSRPKIRTLRALSDAVVANDIDFDRMAQASDGDIHAALTSVKGIGPWTADIYIMFCLGRADAFAPGDLALQIAAAEAMEVSERLSVDELTEAADVWRPWRAVAARLLWTYYAHLKRMKTAIPV